MPIAVQTPTQRGLSVPHASCAARPALCRCSCPAHPRCHRWLYPIAQHHSVLPIQALPMGCCSPPAARLQNECKDQMAQVMDAGEHSVLVSLHHGPARQGRAKDGDGPHQPATQGRHSSGGAREQHGRRVTTIVCVCHNMPPYMGRPAAWRACERCPAPGAYAVGRAMLETDRCGTPCASKHWCTTRGSAPQSKIRAA